MLLWLVVSAVALLVVWKVIQGALGPEVQVSAVSRGPLVGTVSCPGVVEGHLAKVGPKTTGVVRETYKEEGDWVRSDELLCRVAPQPGLPATETSQLVDIESIRAPFDGRVARRYVDPGDPAVPGQPLYAVVKPGEVWVVALVDDIDAGNVATGQEMRVSAPSYLSQPLTGRVGNIGSIAEPRSPGGGGGTVVRVRVELPSLPRWMKPGMEVNVDSTVTLRRDALLCPGDAIVEEGLKTFAWVAENGRVRQRAVTLGLNNYQAAEVTSGLAEGDLVVVQGKDKLKPGQRVRPMPTEAPSTPR